MNSGTRSAAWHVSLAMLCLLAFAGGAPAAETGTRKPNILFLFSDDQRADTIGALGNPVIKTPNLDRLVRSGMVFTNAYCLGSNVSAVCLPSRNMLLCGRTYFRWQGHFAPAEFPNVPDVLNSAGYETYHHGKPSNCATLIQKRFDHNKYVDEDADRKNGHPGRDIVDEAIGFLKGRDASRPFFMYLAFTNPHDPRVAAPEYRDLYRPEEIPLPRNYLPLHPFDNGDMDLRDERLAPWPRTREEVRRQVHDYYGVISGLDLHIGRLLAVLRELALSENTIIIYSSDHGLALGSHGLFGKQNLYECGMKVPLIVSGPGIKPGRSDALVYLLDLFPTLCDLVGAPVPEGLDGKSFAAVLRGAKYEPRETLFLAYREVQRAVRDRRWKLIRYPQVDVTQLFDLENDPDERNDLAGDPSQARRIQSLTAEIRAWQKTLGDETPLEVANPRPKEWKPPEVGSR